MYCAINNCSFALALIKKIPAPDANLGQKSCKSLALLVLFTVGHPLTLDAVLDDPRMALNLVQWDTLCRVQDKQL